MAEILYAKKGNQVKKFTRNAWNLLKDKNGWSEVDMKTAAPVSAAKIEIKKTTPPPTGDKQVVENTAPKAEVTAPVQNGVEGAALATDVTVDDESKKEEVVEETAAPVSEEVVADVTTDVAATTEANGEATAPAPEGDLKEAIVSEITKEQAFIDFVKANLTKGLIKDYFDKPEVKVSYSNTMNVPQLATLLGEKLEFSIEKVTEEFKLGSL